MKKCKISDLERANSKIYKLVRMCISKYHYTIAVLNVALWRLRILTSTNISGVLHTAGF